MWGPYQSHVWAMPALCLRYDGCSNIDFGCTHVKYVCICTYIYIYVSLSLSTYIYINTHTCLYVCMHACMQACMHACIHVCTMFLKIGDAGIDPKIVGLLLQGHPRKAPSIYRNSHIHIHYEYARSLGDSRRSRFSPVWVLDLSGELLKM